MRISAWSSDVCSSDLDGLFQVLVERPEGVVVARNGYLIREGGGTYTQRRWLTAVTDEDLDEAVEVSRDAGLRTIAVLDGYPEPPKPLGGASLESKTTVSVIGIDLYLHSYELAE